MGSEATELALDGGQPGGAGGSGEAALKFYCGEGLGDAADTGVGVLEDDEAGCDWGSAGGYVGGQGKDRPGGGAGRGHREGRGGRLGVQVSGGQSQNREQEKDCSRELRAAKSTERSNQDRSKERNQRGTSERRRVLIRTR